MLAYVAGFSLLLVFGVWGALRLAEQGRAKFSETCEALGAEPVFGDPWMCVRDHEPVYVDE